MSEREEGAVPARDSEVRDRDSVELKWKLENAGSTGDTSYAESTNR